MCFICSRTLLPITAESDIQIIKLCYTDANGGIFGYYYREFRYNLQCETPKVSIVKRVNPKLPSKAIINEGYHAFLKQGAVVSTNPLKNLYEFGDQHDSRQRTFALDCNDVDKVKVFEGYIPKGTWFYKCSGEVVAESIVLTGVYDFDKEQEPKESTVSRFFKFLKKIFNINNYVLDWSR